MKSEDLAENRIAIRKWIYTELQNNLITLKSIPSCDVCFFVDTLESVSIVMRPAFWQELVDFRAGLITLQEAIHGGEIAKYTESKEITSTWRYMPPALRKLGAKLYMSSGFSPSSVGYSQDTLLGHLAENQITEESLREAMAFKPTSVSALAKALKSELGRAGWDFTGTNVLQEYRKQNDFGTALVKVDCGGRWPGFGYELDFKDQHRTFRNVSLESLVGIARNRWDSISETNLAEAAIAFKFTLEDCIKVLAARS